MASIKDVFTKPQHEEGTKFFIYDPEWKETEHWIVVRGVDSDAFAAAVSKEQSRSKSEADPDAKQDMRERKYRITAALVASWSFEEDCTPENVLTLLREAPQICDQINSAAERTAFWIQKKSESSNPQPKQDSPLSDS